MKKVLMVIALVFSINNANASWFSSFSSPKNDEVKKIVLNNYKNLFNTSVSCSLKKISNLEILKKGEYNKKELYWPFTVKAKIQESCNSMGGFAGAPSLFGADKVSVEVLKLQIRLYKDDYGSYTVRRVNFEYANKNSTPKQKIVGKWVMDKTSKLVFNLDEDGTTAHPKTGKRTNWKLLGVDNPFTLVLGNKKMKINFKSDNSLIIKANGKNIPLRKIW